MASVSLKLLATFSAHGGTFELFKWHSSKNRYSINIDMFNYWNIYYYYKMGEDFTSERKWENRNEEKEQ